EHAATCARCRAALGAAAEIDTLLGAALISAPEGFSERVMNRVADASTARAHAETLLPPSFVWWVQAAAQPTSALAAVLAALVLWQGDALRSIATLMAVDVGTAVARLGAL